MLPIIVPIAESSQLFEARRAGLRLANMLGWNETLAGKLEIILSEATTNLMKHAERGEIYLRICQSDTGEGIELLALDRGPGVAHIEACLADGYSTTGTAGTGLGAIARLSDEFDIYSQAGKGTCLLARLFPAPNRERTLPKSSPALVLGIVQVPVQGETECGDNWGIRIGDGQTVILLADGLGHGIGAAEASSEAVAVLHRAKDMSPAAILELAHAALRPTRGAAVGIAQIDLDGGQVRFAGAGNISAVLLSTDSQQHMISHNGTVGHNIRKIQEFSYPWKHKMLLVMHSDGINTSWHLDAYPGIAQRDPSLLAGLLLRDASRGRDDACVLVGRVKE